MIECKRWRNQFYLQDGLDEPVNGLCWPCSSLVLDELLTTTTEISNRDVEFHTYPLRQMGGQQTGRACGVLAMHHPSGIAVFVEDERSQFKNRELAMTRLTRIVSQDKILLDLQHETEADHDE